MSDTPSGDPAVPILARTLAVGALLEQAAKELPALEQDGLVFGVHLDERGVSVAGTIQIHDVTGALIASRTWTGDRALSGQIRWRF